LVLFTHSISGFFSFFAFARFGSAGLSAAALSFCSFMFCLAAFCAARSASFAARFAADLVMGWPSGPSGRASAPGPGAGAAGGADMVNEARGSAAAGARAARRVWTEDSEGRAERRSRDASMH